MAPNPYKISVFRRLTRYWNESRSTNTMKAKISVFALALIGATPVFAAVGGAGSAGSASASNSTSSSAGASHYSSGAVSGGGGHVGGGGGGVGRSGGSLGGRGAAASARGATLANHGALHPGTMHAARAAEGRHTAMAQPPSKITGMHPHHHILRHEPHFGNWQYQQYSSCIQFIDPLQPWSDCLTPTKTGAGRGANRRS